MLRIRKNNLFKRIIALTLCVCMLTTALPFFTTSVYAASKTGVLKAVIDGASEFDIRKLDFEDENNTYLSLRDIATALNNTSKAFSFEVTNNGAGLVVKVNTNENYSNPYTAEVEEDSNADEGETNDENADDGSMSDVDAGNADSDDNIDASDANASDNASGEQKVAKTVNHARNRINICIDDVDYYFYAMIVKDDDAVFDCYMSLTEFSIVMNVDCKFEDGRLVINSENDFNLAEMNFV